MSQEVRPQRKPVRQADYYWWSASLGALLLVLNGGFYFQFLLSGILGWSIPLQDNFGLQLLLYFLLGFFCSFLVGGIRGHVNKQTGTAFPFNLRAELIGILPIILVSVVIGILITQAAHSQVISNFLIAIAGNYRGDDMVGIEFLMGWYYLVVLGCIQIFVDAGGVKLGGLIGSHFLRQRARPDEAAQP